MRGVVALFVLSVLSIAVEAQISGVVTDGETGDKLPGATVLIPETGEGTATDEEGRFTLRVSKDREVLLKIRMVGYESQTLRAGAGSDRDELQIALNPGIFDMDEVVVMGGLFQRSEETPYQTSRVDKKQLEHGGQVTLMDAVADEAGIDMISLGPAISKPMIRGLSFSRVMTVYNGLRLENQQWGADHGLWASGTGIEGVEVIKGPASIIYGSGALGGVVQLLEEPPMPRGENSGYYRSGFFSNSLGVRNELGVRGTSESGYYYSIRGSYESHADYIDGDGRPVGNSRFSNRVFKADAGFQKSFGTVKLSLHEIDQTLGIIDDNEMTESLAGSRNDRNSILPFQFVNDRFASMQSTFYTGNKSSLQANFNYHRHSRREIEEAYDLVDLGLLLHTYNYDIKYRFRPMSNVEITGGVQGFYQENENMEGAADILIPDADINDAAAYVLATFKAGEWTTLLGGRFDHRTVKANTERLGDFLLPGPEELREMNVDFSGYTASAGFVRNLNENLRVKFNAAKGFRAPDLAELFSNGEHPGTQRYELGDPGFEREENFEADLGIEGDYSKVKFFAAGFVNYIDNYIYFNPTDEQRGDLTVWVFEQNDARLAGAEAGFSLTPFKRLHFRHNSSYTEAVEAESGEHLPMIPPYKSFSKLSYHFNEYECAVTHRFAARQSRISSDERVTPSYQLFDLSVLRRFNLDFIEGSLGVSALNVLNETYFNHVALTREFGVRNPGRNFRVKLHIRF